MVWYRVRNFARSWCILIIVLLLHGALLYVLLQKLAQQGLPLPPQNRIIESAPVFIMDSSAPSTPTITSHPPKPIESEFTSCPFDPIVKLDPIPSPEKPPQHKDEMLFASLYQKANAPDETKTVDATDWASPEPEPEESPIVDPLTIINEVEKKERLLTPDSIAPQKVVTPPVGVATDDIPMAFEGGVHTTQLSARDTLFHAFIKTVNTALYTSMREGTPPFSPGVQPLVIRMVIVRTGRLAQRPTIVRSSGNINRDVWYVDAIVRASASFPPIPEALHLPFAEMMFKEGTRGQTP